MAVSTGNILSVRCRAGVKIAILTVVLCLVCACSTKKNTPSTRFYHAQTCTSIQIFTYRNIFVFTHLHIQVSTNADTFIFVYFSILIPKYTDIVICEYENT